MNKEDILKVVMAATIGVEDHYKELDEKTIATHRWAYKALTEKQRKLVDECEDGGEYRDIVMTNSGKVGKDGDQESRFWNEELKEAFLINPRATVNAVKAVRELRAR